MRRRVAAIFPLLLALLLAAPHAARADAVAFQANPEHTGDAGDVGLRMPLRRAWQVRLPGRISLPVAAGGRVYVSHNPPGFARATAVVAISIATGAVVWRRELGPDSSGAGLGYGDGRVVVATSSGDHPGDPGGVLALDAANGDILWAHPGGLLPAEPPVVDDGVAYLADWPQSSVTALRLNDGVQLWSTLLGDGSPVSVAVDGDAIYSHDGFCGPANRLRRSDGAVVWSTGDSCTFDGWTPALHRGRLYTEVWPHEPRRMPNVLDAADGAPVARIRMDEPPAFRGGVGVFPYRGAEGDDWIGHTLIARDLATGRARWRFRGDGYLDSAPLIASGVVFAASGTGRVFGVSLRTGRRVWQAAARTPVPAPDGGRVGLAAAERTLFVPALGRLIAYR